MVMLAGLPIPGGGVFGLVCAAFLVLGALVSVRSLWAGFATGYLGVGAAHWGAWEDSAARAGLALLASALVALFGLDHRLRARNRKGLSVVIRLAGWGLLAWSFARAAARIPL